jgi:hypothetical protein
MNRMSAKPPSSIASLERMPDTDTPFSGDCFARGEFANRLTRLVKNMRQGGVLAIDAQWGEGKTWFGRHWQASLRADGWKTVYVDAFSADYVEDPFHLLVAELAELWKGDPQGAKDWLARAIPIARFMATAAPKVLLRAGSAFLLGSDAAKSASDNVLKVLEKGGGALSDEVEDAASKSIGKYIDALRERQSSVDGLRSKLAGFASELDRPLLVFVDELDRCRPDFALAFLERIKHLFEVPNVVFVLLLNRQQLEETVRTAYGANSDASAYLQRFITYAVRLPRAASIRHRQSSFSARFLRRRCVDLGIASGDGVSTFTSPGQIPNLSEFCDEFATYAATFGLSYRDCERALSYFIVARSDVPLDILSFVIFLKTKHPTLLDELMLAVPSRNRAYDKVSQILGSHVGAEAPSLVRMQMLLAAYHTGIAATPEALDQLGFGSNKQQAISIVRECFSRSHAAIELLE